MGFSISKQLSAQGHSVTVIDQSSEDIKKINDTQDVKGIVGRATLPSVLESAGAEKADMIIAVTRNDETNMIVCQLASSLFNVSKKIARIRTKDFLEGKWGKLYNKSNIPIDVIISPGLIPAVAAGPSTLDMASTSRPASTLPYEGIIPRVTLSLLGVAA